MKSRRHRHISVLLVPDGNAEPYSFRLSMSMVKFILVFGMILVIHVLAGGFAYYKWYAIATENSELVDNNIRLLKDNKRIFQLEQQVLAWKDKQSKLLEALGVKNSAGASYSAGEMQAARNFDFTPEKSNQVEIKRQTRNSLQNDSRIRVKSNKSRMNEYLPNLPTALPVEQGYRTDGFAPHWLYGKRHFGIDIAGERGAQIRAAGNGVVIFAGYTSILGNLVIISHGDEIFSFYGHNSSLLVSERAYVKKNDPIATLGDTGESTGPHLHFEIWQGGKPVDPSEYVLALQDE